MQCFVFKLYTPLPHHLDLLPYPYHTHRNSIRLETTIHLTSLPHRVYHCVSNALPLPHPLTVSLMIIIPMSKRWYPDQIQYFHSCVIFLDYAFYGLLMVGSYGNPVHRLSRCEKITWIPQMSCCTRDLKKNKKNVDLGGHSVRAVQGSTTFLVFFRQLKI